MALLGTTVWEINAGATASNVNGGGFNPQNANFMTDLTTDTNTGNTTSPVVSSATYNFVAGDVGHWLYVASGTNWYPGWYKIASVSSNKATLSADTGSADVVQVIDRVTSTAIGIYGANTAVGVASVGTPTGGTFGIDYSQGTAAIINNTDLACADGNAASPTVTSAGTPFGRNHVGNIIHVTAGTDYTAGWYEIVSVSGTTATLDRAVGLDGALTGGTFYVGGALSMNSTLDDDVLELPAAGKVIFVKNNGTVSIGETVSVALAGTAAAGIHLVGYNSQRGDSPTGDNRPLLNIAASAFTLGTRWVIKNLRTTGTGTAALAIGNTGIAINVKARNTSTTAARPAIATNTNTQLFNVEAISWRGIAISNGNTAGVLYGCNAHDSDEGLRVASTGSPLVVASRSIFHSNKTAAVRMTTTTTGPTIIDNCTLYGAENKLGIGLSVPTGATAQSIKNSIIYGFATGVSCADTNSEGFDDYNDYYNNTSDVSSVTQWQKGPHCVAVDPAFTNVTQVTGSGATSSTNVLTDGSADFTALGVTTLDHINLVSGTGTGFVAAIFGITSVGTTTLTLSSNITSSGSGSSIVYQLTLGKNFLPTGSV